MSPSRPALLCALLGILATGDAAESGLRAEFFDFSTSLSAIPNLTGLTPGLSRTDAQVNYPSTNGVWIGLPAGMSDTFASRHSGTISIATAASYTFYLKSDDGSRLWLDGTLLIDNDGVHGMVEKSASRTLTAGSHDLRIEFFENGGGAGLIASWAGPGIAKQIIPASVLSPPATLVAGLKAEFFDFTTGLSLLPSLSGLTPQVVRIDAQINYPSVTTVWSGLPATMADTFASRHTGKIDIPATGTYTFFTSSDDGSKLWINNGLVVSNDGLHGMVEKSGTISLNAGSHDIRVECFDNQVNAGLIVSWSGPGISKQVIPGSRFSTPPLGGGSNTAPVANGAAIAATEDTDKIITLTASDADGDALTWTITQQPANATLTGAAPNLTFRGALNWNGTTSFKFRVSDGKVNSAEATMTVTVAAVNDAPLITAPATLTTSSNTVAIDTTVTDPDGQPITIVWSKPNTQWVTFSNPNSADTSVQFARTGTYQLTVTARDNASPQASASKTITVTVNGGGFTISGRVLDNNVPPNPGSVVQLLWLPSNAVIGTSTTSTSTGDFSFAGLMGVPTDYQVVVPGTE